MNSICGSFSIVFDHPTRISAICNMQILSKLTTTRSAWLEPNFIHVWPCSFFSLESSNFIHNILPKQILLNPTCGCRFEQAKAGGREGGRANPSLSCICFSCLCPSLVVVSLPTNYEPPPPIICRQTRLVSSLQPSLQPLSRDPVSIKSSLVRHHHARYENSSRAQ